jgi:hypothetical protein
MPDTVQVPPSVEASTWSPPDPNCWGAPRIVAATLILVAGLGVATLRYVGEEAQFGLERLLQAGAWGALVAMPAALVAMSPHRRAVLLVPAGMLLTPLAFLSLAGVLLPLLVPGVLVWVALATRWDGLPCGAVRGGSAVMSALGAVVLAAAMLLTHADPRTVETAGGTLSTSDVVTPVEALVVLGVLAAGLFAAWALAAPRRVRARRGG